MATRAEAAKAELVERLARMIHDRHEPDVAATAEEFVRQYYRNVPPGDILDVDPEALYGAPTALLGFARRRRPGAHKLRVYNPRVPEHGWQSDHTVIEIVNDDMPFLVDSLTAELNRLQTPPIILIHPIYHLTREADGTLAALLCDTRTPPSRDTLTESVMHVEIAEQHPDRLPLIAREITAVLDQVRAAVTDWRHIQDRVRAAMDGLSTAPTAQATGATRGEADETAEVRDFLAWLLDDHFTFLGHRNHTFTRAGDDPRAITVGAEDGLGILRDPDQMIFDELRNFADLPEEAVAFLDSPTILLITKANRRARVHRAVHMDVIGVKRFDDAGRVCGLHLLAGLFTSDVYNNAPAFVPVLRRKVERLVARAGFLPSSHNGKRLLDIVAKLPRDELFQMDDECLYQTALGILHLQERQRTALFVRRDAFERFVSCLVFVPRDRYDTRLRLAIRDILERAFHGTMAAYGTQVSESPLARLHFVIRTREGLPAVEVADVERRIAEAARAWSDHLREVILAAKGEERGTRLAHRWAEAFPGFYRERFNAQAAVFDIDRMEEALTGDRLAMNLYHPLEAAPDAVNLKIYTPDDAVPLSDVLPMLENMGFRVIGEVPYQVRPDSAPGETRPADGGAGDRGTVWIHDFTMTAVGGADIKVSEVRQTFQDALARVWAGEVENDGFNRLVVAAGLDWREVVVVRAYARYLRQAAFTFSQTTVEAALAGHPEITRALIRLFHARFDPRGREAEEPIREHIATLLDGVSSPDDDRILRRYLNLIGATLRTNHFQAGPDGGPKPALAFKIDSKAVEDLPLPRPWVEVWVHSPRVEAVHLRGGKVARGGIRWSDRREDFRTEVLGLMKAQMVKNAVIVPVGSKGGFVVRRPPPLDAGREAAQAEGVACYQTFIGALLDVTDDLDGETVVPPPDVVRHDADDAYLVVAADKGTATFSDIANAIAVERGFWLGDAFASGGSKGYDHKQMGITARGAWEAVKRHFREMGRDTQSEDFTVAGVGDMSGDVFGNGMLLSRHVRLVAAFNHLHVFLDPDPDPETSFAERERLFGLPRSTWADYDAGLISEGGGVFSRRAKWIPLNPRLRALLDIPRDRATPNEVIRAVLRMRVDLLWFGGIGTYLRASDEVDSEVGDRANDAVRVTAREVRARVIGEGANLGCTQRARIEYAMTGGPDGAGGRLNTDAIDNSAGVDTSDHEVNIKILLNRLVADGDLTGKQRDRLLAEMTDDVARLVLRDNYLQTQAISIVQAQGGDLLDHQHRLMRMLERAGRLDRALEVLPDDEGVAERMAASRGLTRPEISVLIPYSKMWLYDEILDSDLPDDPRLTHDLLAYFPSLLHDRFADAVRRHKLRREIVATHATNSMINRVGGTFVTQIIEKTGRSPSDIARAYVVARDAFALRDLWSDVEALDTVVPAAVQLAMLVEANRLIERVTLWVLRHAPRPLDVGGLVDDLAGGAEVLRACEPSVFGEEVAEEVARRAGSYRAEGVPDALAERVGGLIVLASAPDVVRLAGDCTIDLPTAAANYFAVGRRFGLGWLRAVAEGLEHGSHWEKLAVAAVIDELYADQRAITVRVLAACAVCDPARPDPETAIGTWVETRAPEVERADQLLGELRAAKAIDLAMLTVASRQLGMLKGT